MTVDVTVMGGGIFGLSIAYECARRGAKVTVIERNRIGAGSSGGPVGALAPHVPERWNAKKAFQLEALLIANQFWQGVQQTSGLDPAYARTGRIQPLPDDQAVEQAHIRTIDALELWQGQAEWRVTGDSPGWCGASPTGLWIHDTLSARIAPRAALAALARAIVTLGGKIVEEGGRPSLAEPDGTVVWATGLAGLEELNQSQGHLAGNGVKGQAARFCAAVGPDAPQLFTEGLHFVPHADGTLAVGSTSERYWQEADTTDAQLEGLIDHARRLCPALRNATLVERWAGVRPRAITRAPLLGPWPGRPGHYIANGGFKIGFGIAPKVASTMADLLLDGRQEIPQGFLPAAATTALAPGDGS
ncbi:MAG: FAD-dependent oxidoreductase [Paracoccaceae bacterium]